MLSVQRNRLFRIDQVQEIPGYESVYCLKKGLAAFTDMIFDISRQICVIAFMMQDSDSGFLVVESFCMTQVTNLINQREFVIRGSKEIKVL